MIQVFIIYLIILNRQLLLSQKKTMSTPKYKVKILPSDSGRWRVKITPRETPKITPKHTSRKLTIFLQGLQGNGKTTIAKTLCRHPNWEYIEQDQYEGDTRKCQQALIGLLKSDTQVVIISRCNINYQQYRKYLEISLDYGEVLFLNFTDTQYNSKTSLMLARSIAGVINRSESSENVVFGHNSVPIDDAIEYTSNNMKYWSPNKKAINIPILQYDHNIISEIENSKSLKKFVIDNTGRIMSLSIPLRDIVSNIESQIDNISRENIITKEDYKDELLKKTIFISFKIEKPIRKKLTDFSRKYGKGNFKCEHITQIFMNKDIFYNIVALSSPNDIVNIVIDSLVINLENGMSAFRVKNILSPDGENIFIHSKCPHITACVPDGCQPKDSLVFVSKNDDSVKIIPFELSFEGTCVYHQKRK